MALVPRYERQVQYQSPGIDDSRSMAHRELAQSLGQLGNQLGQMAAQSSAAIGEEEGKIAGGQGRPEKRSDITVRGRAFNQAAMQAYRAGLDADMRQTLARLADENRNDSESFGVKSSEYLSSIIKDIDPTVEQEVRNDFALRTQAYRQSIVDGERRRARLQMAGQLEEDTKDLTDSIYRSARDGLADIVAADRVKLAERIKANTISDENPEGIVSPDEAVKILAAVDDDVVSEYTFGNFLRTLQNDGIDQAKASLDTFSKAKLSDLGMNPDRRDALVNKMEAEIRGAESVAANKSAINKSLFGQRVQDEIAMHRDGVEPPSPLSLSDFITTYGAEEGAFRFNELQQERSYGQAVRQAVNASPQEQEAMLQQMTPKPGEGYEVQSKRFDQMRAAVQQVNAARQKDPGLYAARNLEGLNPEQQVRASLATQERWGIQNPKPLPNGVSSQLVADFSKQAGPDAAAKFIELQATYGKEYPAVYRQLVADGLPPAFVAIGAGMEPGPASLLAEVANIDMKELKSALPETAAPKDINAALTTIGSEFSLSMSGMPGSETTFAAMRDAAERLAYRYARQEGVTSEDAAQRAWDDVVGKRYSFEEHNGGIIRIPNDQPAAVTDRLDEVISKISPGMLAEAIGAGPGYKPEQLAATVKSRAQFVTTEEEDGVYLFMDGRPVQGRGGLIKFTWREMLDPGSIRSAPVTDQKLTTGAY